MKLIIYLNLYGPSEIEEIEKVLDGSQFIDVGVLNFIEEDFFAWTLEEEIKEKNHRIDREIDFRAQYL